MPQSNRPRADAPTGQGSPKPTCLPAAVLVATALAVKLAVLLQLRHHPLLQPHGELDTAYYLELGRRLAAEGLLAPVDTTFVSPLYVYALAAVFAAGGSTFTAQLVQIGLGAAAVGLSYVTARHWFGERSARLGAVLAVLTGIFTFNEILILQSALDPFLVAAVLYSLTRAVGGGGLAAHAAAGAGLGLLTLNRPNALVFAVAATAGVALVAWRHRHKQSDTEGRATTVMALRPALLLTSTLLLVLAANAARNAAVSGEAVVIASHGGLNFYIGNHEGADGTYTPVPGITPSMAGQARDAKRIAEVGAGRDLSASDVSAFFTRQATTWIAEHPAAALALTLRKLAILVNRVDVPLNYSLAYYAAEPGALLRLLAIGPWLLLPAGLLGLAWTGLRTHRHGYWIWAMFVPVYGAAVVLFFVADRYRMPMLIPLCATAGAALTRLADLARTRRFAAFAGAGAALSALAIPAFADLGLDDGRGGEQTRMAVLLVEQGEIDDARRYVAQILPGHRHPGVLQFRVGRALADAGRDAEAIPMFEAALAVDGPQPAIRLALGESLARTGAVEAAVPHLQAAVDRGFDLDIAAPLLIRALIAAGRDREAVQRLPAVPDAAASGAEAALDFATLALEHGAVAQAVRWGWLAVAATPEDAAAHEALGVALFLAGDAGSAVTPLERARELASSNASIHLNLAAVYAELGRVAEARRMATEARRLDPGEPRAAALLAALPR